MIQQLTPLPQPSGQFDVGRIQYHLVDQRRKETYPTDPRHPFRELMLSVWFPAEKDHDDARLPYVSESLLAYMKDSQKEHSWLEAGYVDRNYTTWTYNNARISHCRKSYPVILFSHGASNPIFLYTHILEELASHGFIVVGIAHTHFSGVVEFPDGRIIPTAEIWHALVKENNLKKIDEQAASEAEIWIADTQFVLEKLDEINNCVHQPLAGKMNLAQLGIFGHSFGGGIAARMVSFDKRFKGGADMDGPIYGPPIVQFDKPFLFLLGKEFDEEYTFTDEQLAEMNLKREDVAAKKAFWRDSVASVLHAAPCLAKKIMLPKADHMMFSDYHFIKPSSAEGSERYIVSREIDSALVHFFASILARYNDEQ